MTKRLFRVIDVRGGDWNSPVITTILLLRSEEDGSEVELRLNQQRDDRLREITRERSALGIENLMGIQLLAEEGWPEQKQSSTVCVTLNGKTVNLTVVSSMTEIIERLVEREIPEVTRQPGP